MARIRSIHPGIWTDETFMALTSGARVLLFGLWTEADDRGVFEWKPLTIKARILPADAVEVTEMLSELERVDVIRQFQCQGRSYGVVRNFGKYQRPKAPKAIHPLPDDLKTYAAADGQAEDDGPMNFTRDVTAADRQRAKRAKDRDARGNCHGSSVTNSEMSRQMEDGGWRIEYTDAIASDAPNAASPSVELTPSQRVWQEYPHQLAAMAGKSEASVRKWMGKALKASTPEAFAAAADAAIRAGTRDPCAYITAALKNTTGPPRGSPPRDPYAVMLEALENPHDRHLDDLAPSPAAPALAYAGEHGGATGERGRGDGAHVLDLEAVRSDRRRA